MSDVYQGRDVAPGDDWWLAGDGKWYHPGLDPERQASETVPPAEGWWRAVDGAWYPPELHPDASTGADVRVDSATGDATSLTEPAGTNSQATTTTVRSEDDLFAEMAAPSATSAVVYPTADLVGVGSRSDDVVDALPFVDAEDDSNRTDAKIVDAKIGDTKVADAPADVDDRSTGPGLDGLDPLKNPSPALSMPVPPMPQTVKVADELSVPETSAAASSASPTMPPMPAMPAMQATPTMPAMPEASGSATIAPAALPADNIAPMGNGTLSPSLTPADIAGPIFPTPTAAPADPVSAGERMVLPTPGAVIDHASVPTAGAPIHLPAPTSGDARHDLPPPATAATPAAGPAAAGGADLGPPPPIFSPNDVVPTAPEVASQETSQETIGMNEFATSDSDQSMDRLDESRSKRKLGIGIGAAALLAIGGLFLFNQFRGGEPNVVTPQASAIAVTEGGDTPDTPDAGGAAPDQAVEAVDVGTVAADTDPAQVLNKLRTTGIQGTDDEVTTFANGVCAEVDSGSSWAQVLTYASNSELAITDPGMVAKVIASVCPGGG